jgi:hypothetical protein
LSRSSGRRLAALTFVLHVLAARSHADSAMFEVGGTLEPAPAGVSVRLALRNTGAATAEDVKLFATLLGTPASAEVGEPLRAGASFDVRLVFPTAVPVAGVHALVIRLEYTSLQAGRTEAMNQYAYLLLGFGSQTAPAVRIQVANAQLVDTAPVAATLASTDGRAHQVRLSIYLPRTLGVVPQQQMVEVPAQGEAHATFRVFRSLATYESAHGLLAVAVSRDDDVIRTAASTAIVSIGADGALLPRLRFLLLGVALALVMLAAAAEHRRPRSVRPA